MTPSVLKDIPDPQAMDLDALLAWLNEKIATLHNAAFTPESIESAEAFECSDAFSHALGPEASSTWRRLFLATLLADWACYDDLHSRADFARLKYVMTSAYPYVRLWFCRMADGTSLPVGYSLGYPIAKFVYDSAQQDKNSIRGRGVFLPLRFVEPKDIHYGYAFNVSIIKPLRNTILSRRLIKAYQRDGKKFGNIGVVAVTVDEAGSKFARLAKMTRVGDIVKADAAETLFIRTPAPEDKI